MKLVDWLETINKVNIGPLPNGHAETIGDFYDQVIERNLPAREIVLAWQHLLYEYVSRDDAIYFLRRYHSASQKNWNTIRRGFLTEYEHGGYVCCDNFFAHYIYTLALAGHVPTLNDFAETIRSRKFPYGFMSTKEEEELQAYKMGKQPKLASSSWKLAHLFPVNAQYNSFANNSYVNEHFPRGSRDDWKRVEDGYYARVISREMDEREKKYLSYHFLRFVSPMNYFLVPKRDNEHDLFGNNIGENKEVLEYVLMRFSGRYGSNMDTFLRFADVPNELQYGKDRSGTRISIEYRSGRKPFADQEKPELATHKTKSSFSTKPVVPSQAKKWRFSGSPDPKGQRVTTEQLHQMAKLYLEESVSFRNLERGVLGIDSKARGGGFVAKTALNDFGITAQDKGMLSKMSVSEAINTASEPLYSALRELYG